MKSYLDSGSDEIFTIDYVACEIRCANQGRYARKSIAPLMGTDHDSDGSPVRDARIFLDSNINLAQVRLEDFLYSSGLK